MTDHNEPAFPGIRGENGCGNETRTITPNGDNLWVEHNQGITIRDYFAAHCQEDDRLVKCIRAMDDESLEIFARFPELEREECLTEVHMDRLTCWPSLGTEVAKVTRRLELEAKAIARVRYMQADAMLAARETPQ